MWFSAAGFSARGSSPTSLVIIFAVLIHPLSLSHLETCVKGDREAEEKLAKRYFSISAGASALG